MTPKKASTKDLLYAAYRYEHCRGYCLSCPCYNEGYICTQLYEEIVKEISKRKGCVQDENN